MPTTTSQKPPSLRLLAPCPVSPLGLISWAVAVTLLGCAASGSAPADPGASGGSNTGLAGGGGSVRPTPVPGASGGLSGTNPGVGGAGANSGGGPGAGGNPGAGGSPGAGGNPGTGGNPGAGGSTSIPPDAGGGLPMTTDTGAPPVAPDGGAGDPRFSFFYTSLQGMQRLSKSLKGFGGDLRFGQATGLEGADKICQTLASDVGYGNKTWRAFLSVVKGPGDKPAHAIDRVGNGPWYDRTGRLIAMNKAGLARPDAASPRIVFPEDGDVLAAVINENDRPDGDPQGVSNLIDETGGKVSRDGDLHDVITGSNILGQLDKPDPTSTCLDWTSSTAQGSISVGHAFPYGKSGYHWIATHDISSCIPGINSDPASEDHSTIGSSGGYGGFYCLAVQP